MARPSKEPQIQCENFTWRLFNRDGVFYADGRGERHELGKHSLATRNRQEALENLRRLDQSKAIELGLVAREPNKPTGCLSIESGWALFMEDRGRPEHLGGIGRNSIKRYRAVRDKHLAFCLADGIGAWDHVDRDSALRYGTWLDRKKQCAAATILLEVNTVAAVVKWLAAQRRIAGSCRFSPGLPKIEDSDTYCYRREEVAAMVAHCQSRKQLHWLADIITALSTTGVRIGELAGIRWTDIDFASNVLRLTDERFSRRRQQLGSARLMKGKRGRSVPLNGAFRVVLDRTPRLDDGRVFHGPRGGKLKPDIVRTTLLRHVIHPLKSTFPTVPGEVGFEHGRVHSFRHYFVSESFRLGVPEARIMEWVGHRDSRIVRRYRHLRDDDGQQAMLVLDFLGPQGRSDGPSVPPS